MSARWRRPVSSVAYSALVALVVALGYLTFHAVSERGRALQDMAVASTERGAVLSVEIANFSARQEKSSDSERLTVSLRMRLTAPGTMNSYVYVLARNDHASPKLWAVWPHQGRGGAVTAGGHLRTNSPKTGEPVHLSSRWTRVTATLAHPPGRAPFETVMVYVVSPKGEIVLSRPFAL
ncbi:MAG: hypothetical protein ACE5I7_06465 [Candidatus Binatia bacterium]